jgi:DNA-binding response OmpR family regulator
MIISMEKSVPIYCVMIIEGDPDIAAMLQDVLKEENIPTMVATTMSDALQITRGLQPLLFLINATLPDGDGVTLYDLMRQRMEHLPISAIILSTNMHIHQRQLEERHITGLEIPFDIDVFAHTVTSLLPQQFS